MSIVNSPLVSVIVLNFRTPKDTVQCVRALRAQTIKDSIEILVVDNHSEDESIGFIRAQLHGIPSVRIIEQRTNIGFGRGNNAAALLAKGKYLLILNPDNTLPLEAVETMVRELQTHKDVGIVGPALVFADGSIRPSARPFPRPVDLLKKRFFPASWHQTYLETNKHLRAKKPMDVDWMVGACVLLETELFRRIGGFDERFFLFFEDIDLCRRIRNEGKRVVYLPFIRVSDRKGRLSGSSALSFFTRKTTRIHLCSALKYFWKWRGECLGGTC